MQRLLYACALVAASPLTSAWSPPENPDPRAILFQAREDRAQKRYDDALAKHLWFHNEALKIDPAFTGVRLSFALADWGTLASRYKPAMTALKAVRDAAGEDVRGGRNTRRAFAEYAAINRELDEEKLTRVLFAWIEARDPALARAVYDNAEGALLEANDYVTCGRYMDPAAELERLAEVHRHLAARTKDGSGSPMEAKVSESYFANHASRIVALLVLNNRRPEAVEAAASARKILDTPGVETALKRALEGTMPGPLLTKAQRKSLRAVMP